MRVRKAVITAAGDRHGSLPLQSVVDRSGEVRTALRLTLDEIVSSGVEDIAIVVRPGQQDSYLSAAGPHASRLIFFEQHNPRGYGDAILRTADFVQQQPVRGGGEPLQGPGLRSVQGLRADHQCRRQSQHDLRASRGRRQ